MSKPVILIIAGIFGVSALGFLAFSAYIGLFSTPKATETVIGPYTYVYEEFVGEYKKSGPVFDKVYYTLRDKGISTTLGLGVYFDDPAVVPADKLRSHCGVVLEEKDLDKLTDLKKRFKAGQFSRSKRLVVEFPIKNGLSYMVGPMKCYPVLMRYAKEKGYKPDALSFEVYDETAGRILFVMEIEALREQSQ